MLIERVPLLVPLSRFSSLFVAFPLFFLAFSRFFSSPCLIPTKNIISALLVHIHTWKLLRSQDPPSQHSKSAKGGYAQQYPGRESKIKIETNLDESHVALAVRQVVAKVRHAPLASPPPDVHIER